MVEIHALIHFNLSTCTITWKGTLGQLHKATILNFHGDFANDQILHFDHRNSSGFYEFDIQKWKTVKPMVKGQLSSEATFFRSLDPKYSAKKLYSGGNLSFAAIFVFPLGHGGNTNFPTCAVTKLISSRTCKSGCQTAFSTLSTVINSNIICHHWYCIWPNSWSTNTLHNTKYSVDVKQQQRPTQYYWVGCCCCFTSLVNI